MDFNPVSIHTNRLTVRLQGIQTNRGFVLCINLHFKIQSSYIYDIQMSYNVKYLNKLICIPVMYTK